MNVKYKAPDGTIYKTADEAVDGFCRGKSCECCPLDKAIGVDDVACSTWVAANPERAAELMGLVVIGEEPLEVDPATNLVQEAVANPGEEEPMATYECQNCGGEIEAHQPIFCPWCGLRFDGLDKKDVEVAPPNVRRHWNLCWELNELYERKNHDYGDSFHQSFQEEGMAMARIRLGDKLNRFKTLSKQEIPFEDERKVKDESIRDTLIDLANYAIMTVMEMEENE